MAYGVCWVDVSGLGWKNGLYRRVIVAQPYSPPNFVPVAWATDEEKPVIKILRVPSRSSMLTGLYAHTIRSHANFIHLNPEERTIVHHLKDNGYQTALIGKKHAFADGKAHWGFPATPSKPTFQEDVLHALFDYGVQGKSLKPLLEQDKAYEPREFAVIESGETGEPMKVSDITVKPKDPLDGSHHVWCAYQEAWTGKGVLAFRKDDWKLRFTKAATWRGEDVTLPESAYCLYNLAEDPYENNDLSQTHQKRANEMRELLLDLLKKGRSR